MGSVTTLKKKVKETPDLNSILAGATVPKEKSGKSGAPVLDVPKDVKELVTQIRNVKAELDSAKSMFETLEAELVAKVSPLREKLCSKGYVSAVKVPGAKGEGVSLSFSSRYSKTSLDNADTIEGIIGGERFLEFFTTGMNIVVKDVSEKSLLELIELVGEEKFARFFNVERWITPVERYTTEFFNTFTQEERLLLSNIVRQHKPSVRAR
jgi:hypothetical protein